VTKEDFQRYAEAFVDGEFDEAELAELRTHLADCAESRGLAVDLGAFKELLQHQTASERAPEHLRANVLGALDRLPVPGLSRWTYVLTASAAGLLLLFVNLFGGNAPESLRSELITDPILQTSVDWHRSNLPIEITGPDAEMIREWFADKVDFPVRLPTFDESLNANVLGGRLSHVDNQRAAHVLYEVDGAKVSILLFETHSDLRVPRRRPNSINFEPFQGTRQGYNVALFESNGVTYAITTELPHQTFQEIINTVQFRE
jgi:anti-sigma factor RsiW